MGRFETQWLAAAANLSALADLSGQWIVLVHGRALAYNRHFLRTLATPEPIKDWSLTSLKEKLIKIGAIVRAARAAGSHPHLASVLQQGRKARIFALVWEYSGNPGSELRLQLINPSTLPGLNTTLTPHSIIHGDACFAYFNKIWGIRSASIVVFQRQRNGRN